MECGVFFAMMVATIALIIAGIAMGKANALQRQLDALRTPASQTEPRPEPHPQQPPQPQPPPEPIPNPIAAPPPPPPPPRPEPIAAAPPPVTRPPSPVAPAKPIDWENLVGIRLFSWIAGIALVLAAVFLFKYSVDHGWLRPPIRAGFGLVTGIVLLVVCEMRIARDYKFTANAMLGAGIAILYATLFAMHARWSLIEPWLAFLGMLLVTAAAVFLSTRRDSVFIALLGLLGGFATPALLSSGENRPVALFSYLLLLNGGLSWVAYRKRWPALTALSVLLTVIYQWSWIAKFLDQGQLLLAAIIFVLFAIVSATALWARRGEAPFEFSATAGAVLPLLFAFFTAIVPEYGASYHILFGYLLLMVAGLAAITMWRGPQWLHSLGGGATIITWLIWLLASYRDHAWPWSLLWLTAFVLLYLFARLRIASIAVYTAPILFFVLVALALHEPDEWMLLTIAAFILLILDTAFALRFESVPLLVIGIALITIHFVALDDGPGALQLASLLGVATIGIIAMARNASFHPAAFTALFLAELGALAADDASFTARVVAHAVLLIGVLAVAWVTERYALVLISLPLTALAVATNDHTATQRLIFAAIVYAIFIAWPLALRDRVKDSIAPHLTACAASVIYFFYFWDSLTTLGYDDVIGLLPLTQAAILVIVLWRMPKLDPADTRTAMVAGTALAFITAAIPLQLEKEWITIAWALLAAALAWLYRRVPHQGLIAWSAGLIMAVFIRLVFNPAVFDYHAKSATPIVNWYLYTYLVCAAAAFLAGYFLPDIRKYVNAAGAILLFVLLNIEIADFYSTGSTLTFDFFSSTLAQDLTYTMGWALFAIAMLVTGILLDNRTARVAALGLLLVTILKCFLHDLARLGGLYRVGSLFGLAVSLVLVGILLQKFVMRRREETQPT